MYRPIIRPEDVIFASKCATQEEPRKKVFLDLKRSSPELHVLIAWDVASTASFNLNVRHAHGESLELLEAEKEKEIDNICYAIVVIFAVFYSCLDGELPHLRISGDDIARRTQWIRSQNDVNSAYVEKMRQAVISMARLFGENSSFAFKHWISSVFKTQPAATAYFFLIYSYAVLWEMLEIYK